MKAKTITVDYPDRIITLNGQQADIVMKKIGTLRDLDGIKWKVKLKKIQPGKKLEPSLKKILDGFSTLQLVNNDDPENVEFWEDHLKLMSLYFDSEFKLKVWLTKNLHNIHFWQMNNSKRKSKVASRLRQRINTWLDKEYGKLEKGGH